MRTYEEDKTLLLEAVKFLYPNMSLKLNQILIRLVKEYE
jgi:hypothetical protein